MHSRVYWARGNGKSSSTPAQVLLCVCVYTAVCVCVCVFPGFFPRKGDAVKRGPTFYLPPPALHARSRSALCVCVFPTLHLPVRLGHLGPDRRHRARQPHGAAPGGVRRALQAACGRASRRRGCHSAAPPSPFSMFSNSNVEWMSVKCSRGRASCRREFCHSAAPPSPFVTCSSREEESTRLLFCCTPLSLQQLFQ